MEWKPLQSIAKGFVLTDLLRPEFVEYLEEHFKDQYKCVEAINIQIRVRDEKLTEYTENEIISIANRNGQDTLLKKVIVDADNTETLTIFTEAINKVKEMK